MQIMLRGDHMLLQEEVLGGQNQNKRPLQTRSLRNDKLLLAHRMKAAGLLHFFNCRRHITQQQRVY